VVVSKSGLLHVGTASSFAYSGTSRLLRARTFATLCVNGGNSLNSEGGKKAKPAPVGESGKPLTYRGSKVHRVEPGFIFQGGDFVFGNGTGGESCYNGKKFKDERTGLALKHDRRGILSMGNSGKHSNTSQWFITFAKAPQCDGKHVIFGEVISGFEVLDAIEKVGTSGGEPSVPVTITDCGVYMPLRTPGAGYWYDQPDAETFNGISSTFVVRPRIAIVAPAAAMEKFQKAMGTFVAPVLIPLEKDSNKSDIIKRVNNLMDRFSVDLVVLAPACTELMNKVKVPASWDERKKSDMLEVAEVIVTAKPIEALSVVWRKSWIGKEPPWQLDGNTIH